MCHMEINQDYDGGIRHMEINQDYDGGIRHTEINQDYDSGILCNNFPVYTNSQVMKAIWCV